MKDFDLQNGKFILMREFYCENFVGDLLEAMKKKKSYCRVFFKSVLNFAAEFTSQI